LSAVLFVARGEIRRRWRSALFLMLVVGIVGAAVLAPAAGARRTRTALSRFNADSHSSSLQVTFLDATKDELAGFRASTDVVAAPLFHAFGLVPSVAPGATVVAPVDQAPGPTIDRPHVLSGRLPNPNTTDEIAIDESFAKGAHLRVGDRLDAAGYTPQQIATLEGDASDAGPPAGPKVRLRVVGIVRRPVDLGRTTGVSIPIRLTPAFEQRYANTIGGWGNALLVRTKHGAADLTAVENNARKYFGKDLAFSVTRLSDQNNGAQGAIDVLTIALWVCAAVAALAGATVVAIVLGREINQNGPDDATLQTLGLTRRQRALTYMPFMLLVGCGGVIVAALGAVVFSEMFPIGVARRAEPHLGFSADWTVLALGTVGLLAFVVVIAGISAYRATRPAQQHDTPRASRLSDAVTRASLAPTITSGLGMALQRGKGRAAVPLLSAVVGATLGVVGISGAILYSANLDHLAGTPRLYGWTWDFKANDTLSDQSSCTKDDFGISQMPGVSALEVVCYATANITVDKHATNGWDIVPIRGAIATEMVAGRAPEARDEVALGATTMKALHKEIGDHVTAKGPHGSGDYRIVGETVFPELGQHQRLADGAVFTATGYAPLFDRNNYYRYFVGRFAPDADRAAILRRIQAIPALDSVATTSVPTEVSQLQQTSWTPVGVAALVGGLALLALAHALVTAVRRRRRDLAVLKTIGFERRQVRAVVAWQATTLAAIGLLVGFPAGLLVGGFVWRRIADAIGVADSLRYPASVLLVVPAALLVVNLLAFFPAVAAARTRPAVALRTE
jgi:ABC-type lipoprotein release transport system permease subunit